MIYLDHDLRVWLSNLSIFGEHVQDDLIMLARVCFHGW